MIFKKEFLSLIMVAMEKEKKIVSLIIETIVMSKNCFMENLNLIDSDYHWKNWAEWISARWNKMSQPQKCTYWEKGAEDKDV